MSKATVWGFATDDDTIIFVHTEVDYTGRIFKMLAKALSVLPASAFKDELIGKNTRAVMFELLSQIKQFDKVSIYANSYFDPETTHSIPISLLGSGSSVDLYTADQAYYLEDCQVSHTVAEFIAKYGA